MSFIIEMLDTATGEKKYAGRTHTGSPDEMETFKAVVIDRVEQANAYAFSSEHEAEGVLLLISVGTEDVEYSVIPVPNRTRPGLRSRPGGDLASPR
jgi:hypothetical protein